MAGTTAQLVSDVAAGLAALAAAITVGISIHFGRDASTKLETIADKLDAVADKQGATVEKLEEVVTALRGALNDAQRSREGADRERLRLRAERIGEIVQELFTLGRAEPNEMAPISHYVRGLCNTLNSKLIGLTGELPKTGRVYEAINFGQLLGFAGEARVEVESWLMKMEQRTTDG